MRANNPMRSEATRLKVSATLQRIGHRPAVQGGNGRQIPVAEATLADIYFMAWGREPQHVALISDKGIIHSYSGVGKVVEHGLDDRWQQRISAAYRFPYFKGM